MIVVKFGGTSVGDAEAIERTAAIVKGRLDRQPAVVVSALGGATNSLLAIGEQSAKGHLIGALRGVETLRDRHFQQCDKLLGTSAEAAEVAEEMSATFDELASRYILSMNLSRPCWLCSAKWALTILRHSISNVPFRPAAP